MCLLFVLLFVKHGAQNSIVWVGIYFCIITGINSMDVHFTPLWERYKNTSISSEEGRDTGVVFFHIVLLLCLHTKDKSY